MNHRLNSIAEQLGPQLANTFGQAGLTQAETVFVLAMLTQMFLSPLLPKGSTLILPNGSAVLQNHTP